MKRFNKIKSSNMILNYFIYLFYCFYEVHIFKIFDSSIQSHRHQAVKSIIKVFKKIFASSWLANELHALKCILWLCLKPGPVLPKPDMTDRAGKWLKPGPKKFFQKFFQNFFLNANFSKILFIKINSYSIIHHMI